MPAFVFDTSFFTLLFAVSFDISELKLWDNFLRLFRYFVSAGAGQDEILQLLQSQKVILFHNIIQRDIKNVRIIFFILFF